MDRGDTGRAAREDGAAFVQGLRGLSQPGSGSEGLRFGRGG